MPLETQLAHRNVTQTNLPFISFQSPNVTEPTFVPGSIDILTSTNGYAERRPGFATAVETAATAFNNLQRLFTWERFDGTLYTMACDINASGFAQVFKLQNGVDTSFVPIFTGNASTPFDFVVSNNTLYFSNGIQAQKWDPSNGASNWGIALGGATGPTIAGNGVNGALTGVIWTNPNNVTSTTNYATLSLPKNGQSQADVCTQFGFSIPTTNTILGIAVTLDLISTDSSFTSRFGVALVKAGNALAQSKVIVPGTVSPYTVTVGSVSDLWGSTWVPNDINQSNFGVVVAVATAGGVIGTATFSLRNVRITIYSLGPPAVAVLAGAGTMNAAAGYSYEFCYGNSNTGHVSSPSPISVNTGVFTNKAGVQVTLTASSDSQVNQIRLFRSTDGGGGIYFELPTSPYPNSSGNVTDAAADTALQAGNIAPTPTFNDPPTPPQGMVYFSGRIWGFNANKVYFSGLEEINIGVPEESFPSGIAGDFWAFDQPVQGLGLAGTANNPTLLVFCPGRIYGINGNTLDTFRRFLISSRRGCRNRAAITSLGGMCAWLDTSGQVWATDGNSLQELGRDIRPTTTGLTQVNASMTFHVAGRFHWLVLAYSNFGTIVYDLDREVWTPPWSFKPQYVYSGETSAGNYVLMAATAKKALQMSTTAFNDNGTAYQPIIQTNLFSMVPDYGRRFSYIAVGSYDQPTRTGVPWTIEIDNNGRVITDVLILTDDDPTASLTYTSVVTGLQDTAVTFNRKNGTKLVQNVYQINGPACRWVSLQIKLATADQVDNIYSMLIAYKELGGR